MISFASGHREGSARLDSRVSAMAETYGYHIPANVTTHQKTRYWPSIGATETKVLNKFQNDIVLIRNPFDAIYALKKLKHEDIAYYTLYGKGDCDI